MLETKMEQLKVAIRLEREKSDEGDFHECLKPISHTQIGIISKNLSVGMLKYDYVFPSWTKDTDLYESCVAEHVDSLFQGFDSNLWMFGDQEIKSGDVLSLNIINSFIDDVFRKVKQLSSYYDSSYESRVYIEMLQVSDTLCFDLLSEISFASNEYQNKYSLDRRKEVVSPDICKLLVENGYEYLYHTLNQASVKEISTVNHEQLIPIEHNSTSSSSHSKNCSPTKLKTPLNRSPYKSYSEYKSNQENTPPNNTINTISSLYPHNLNRSVQIMSGKYECIRSKISFIETNYHNVSINDVKNAYEIMKDANMTSVLALIQKKLDNKYKIDPQEYDSNIITQLLQNTINGEARTLVLCSVPTTSIHMKESLQLLKYVNILLKVKISPTIKYDTEIRVIREMEHMIQVLASTLIDTYDNSQKLSSKNTFNKQIAMEDLYQLMNLKFIEKERNSTSILHQTSKKISPQKFSTNPMNMTICNDIHRISDSDNEHIDNNNNLIDQLMRTLDRNEDNKYTPYTDENNEEVEEEEESCDGSSTVRRTPESADDLTDGDTVRHVYSKQDTIPTPTMYSCTNTPVSASADRKRIKYMKGKRTSLVDCSPLQQYKMTSDTLLDYISVQIVTGDKVNNDKIDEIESNDITAATIRTYQDISVSKTYEDHVHIHKSGTIANKDKVIIRKSVSPAFGVKTRSQTAKLLKNDRTDIHELDKTNSTNMTTIPLSNKKKSKRSRHTRTSPIRPQEDHNENDTTWTWNVCIDNDSREISEMKYKRLSSDEKHQLSFMNYRNILKSLQKYHHHQQPSESLPSATNHKSGINAHIVVTDRRISTEKSNNTKKGRKSTHISPSGKKKWKKATTKTLYFPWDLFS